MSQIKVQILKNRLKKLEYYDNIAPFPIYGTDLRQDYKNEIEKMEKDKKTNYDELPVAACKYCMSLHIQNDTEENDVCMSCGSINELEVYGNIHEYLKAKKENEEQ